jgi:hypothetical protein
LVFFLVARDPAPDVQAPHLVVLRPETDLAEWNPELRGPAAIVVRYVTVPDRIPRRIPLRLAVPQQQIDFAAASGEVELESEALVVVAVEADANDVDGEPAEVVAPSGIAVDQRRVVVGANGDVHVPVVEEDFDLRRLRRLCSLDG